MDNAWQLALVVALVAVNAVFAGSELSLISLREGQIRRLHEGGGSGRALARLAQNPNRFLATIQVGITLAGFLASATAAVSLAGPLIELLDPLGPRAAEAVGVFSVTLLLAYVTLVFGELAPKRLALQHAEGWGLMVARPLDVLATAARPAIWVLSVSTNVVVRVLGGDPAQHREAVTRDEIHELVASHRLFSAEERQVIAGALEAGRRSLREVLVPRPHVLGLSRDLPLAEAVEQLVRAGHTRAPVFGATRDEPIGAVHLRNLIGKTGVVADEVQIAPAFPESMPALAALRELQGRHQQLAIVVDEYGAYDGIVTMEDLVEEIVGEIYDEHDRDVIAIVRWVAAAARYLPDARPRGPGHRGARGAIRDRRRIGTRSAGAHPRR